MQVVKPIFLIGAPRSGTTLLYEILGSHKDLSYFTLNLLKSDLARFGGLLGNVDSIGYFAGMMTFLNKDEKSNKPHEAINVWKKHFGTYRYLTENDYDPKIANYYQTKVAAVQQFFKRPRFINKDPQHSVRVRLLGKIFPDSLFVHAIRDGRPVTYSRLVKSRKEPHGSFASSYKDNILGKMFRQDRSEIYNYGLAWGVLVRRAMEASMFGRSRYLEIRYEDLIADPRQELRKILDFCQLDWYSDFEHALPKMRNENVKWEQELSEQEKQDLEESTFEVRQQLGYVGGKTD